MGSHPAIYSALQLHVVNCNQNVLKWLKIRKQMEKWRKCQEHLQLWNLREGVKEDC